MTLTERILNATAFDLCDCIFWRVDSEYAPITFFAECNDVFDWGTSDCERITEWNIEILEQSIKDCKEAKIEGMYHAPILFCARVRKKRPQNRFYKNLCKELIDLYNACGPERKVSLFNPS